MGLLVAKKVLVEIWIVRADIYGPQEGKSIRLWATGWQKQHLDVTYGTQRQS